MLSLKTLDVDQRTVLIIKLLQEQVVDQRKKLAYWRDLTKQPSQIDTGYISQYLLSLITSIYGGLMRGKGTDLDDGSEIKAANAYAQDLDKTVISKDSLSKHDPLHAVYIYAQNKVSVLVEQLSGFPALSKLTDILSKADDICLF